MPAVWRRKRNRMSFADELCPITLRVPTSNCFGKSARSSLDSMTLNVECNVCTLDNAHPDASRTGLLDSAYPIRCIRYSLTMFAAPLVFKP